MKKIAIFSLLIVLVVLADALKLKLNPVLEPASMLLIGVGLVVLSGLKKNFKRK